MKDNELIIQIADKKYIIPSSHLKITKLQTYILRKQGMFKINDINIYDDKKRGDIYIEIHLT